MLATLALSVTWYWFPCIGAYKWFKVGPRATVWYCMHVRDECEFSERLQSIRCARNRFSGGVRLERCWVAQQSTEVQGMRVNRASRAAELRMPARGLWAARFAPAAPHLTSST
jgi:hypothetical protein